ncbi:MAG: sigma 54-interacting transcriptional regulator [bacterium]
MEDDKIIKRPLIGEILIKNGFLNKRQLDEALNIQKKQQDERIRIGEILIQRGVIKEEDLLESLAIQIDTTFLPMMKHYQSLSSLAMQNKSHNIQRYIKTMSFFIEIGILISDNPDINTLVKMIAKKAPEIMEAERSSIFFLDKEEKELCSLVAIGMSGNMIHFDKDLGVAGHVLKTGKLLNITDAYQCPYFNIEIDKKTGYRTRSILCTPIVNPSGKPFGVFQILNKKNGIFTKEDEILLQIMVSQIFIALENINTWNEFKLIKESLNKENENLRREKKKEYGFTEIIGMNDNLLSIMKTVKQTAGFNIPVLIEGESGTGKELMAKAVHYNSTRAEEPFICVNCSAIPENLLESELFGYEKGAFTGAQSSKIGFFEEANKGTLFLDEIGDMEPKLQVKILRFLQNGEIQRLGSSKIKKLDVRIIAATNKNLTDMMKEGRFRDDLYYRINVINLKLSPLREIRDDIPLLIRYFLQKFRPSLNKDVKGLNPEAQQLLLMYEYPGNIRELENIIKRALVISDGPFITPQNLPDYIQSNKNTATDPLNFGFLTSSSKDYKTYKGIKSMARKKLDEHLDMQFIIDLLKENKGNVSRAARQANMNRSLLHQMIQRYQLDIFQYRSNHDNCKKN